MKFNPVNTPVSLTFQLVTVVDALIKLIELTSDDPLYRAAAIVVFGLPVRSELGVKPVPLIETPMLSGVPAITMAEPRVIVGVASTVNVVLAELSAASVTTMFSAVEVSVVGTTNPTVYVLYVLPFACVLTVVPVGSAITGVPPTFSHVVGVPLTVRDCTEFAAKPMPEMATAWPGLTAGSEFSFGVMVNVASAYAPDEP